MEIIRDSLEEAAASEGPRASGQESDQVNSHVTDQESDQVNRADSVQEGIPAYGQDAAPEKRLLAALGEETLSAVELMRRLGLSHRPTFRKNYLNPALEQKLIQRTIPQNPRSRNQKYRKYKTGAPKRTGFND